MRVKTIAKLQVNHFVHVLNSPDSAGQAGFPPQPYSTPRHVSLYQREEYLQPPQNSRLMQHLKADSPLAFHARQGAGLLQQLKDGATHIN